MAPIPEEQDFCGRHWWHRDSQCSNVAAMST